VDCASGLSLRFTGEIIPRCHRRKGVCEKIEAQPNPTLVMAVLDTLLSGLINEQYHGVIPERRASRVLSGIHLSACASFDMDSRQSLCDFGNDVEDNRKKNEPDSRGLDTAIQKKAEYFNLRQLTAVPLAAAPAPLRACALAAGPIVIPEAACGYPGSQRTRAFVTIPCLHRGTCAAMRTE
jgi:hypothetical protein